MIAVSVYTFCCEDPSHIENYDLAINDMESTWDCHHRLEDLGFTREQLKYLGLYFRVPAKELIFLTHAEHTKHHNKGKNKPLVSRLRHSQTAKEKGSYKGPNNSHYKWVCPLILAYRKNILGESMAEISAVVGFKSRKLPNKFKEYNIPYKRKSTKKRA